MVNSAAWGGIDGEEDGPKQGECCGPSLQHVAPVKKRPTSKTVSERNDIHAVRDETRARRMSVRGARSSNDEWQTSRSRRARKGSIAERE